MEFGVLPQRLAALGYVEKLWWHRQKFLDMYLMLRIQLVAQVL
jgi:hypothetical protein